MSDHAVTTQLTVADGVPAAPHAPQSADTQAALLGIETRPEGYTTLVVVSGAIDLVTEQALHHGLSQALARSERGIELDLSGVDFCDCSGLNVLLRVRRRALGEGKIITIRSAGAAVLRLFAITGTLPLFAGTGAADEGDETGQALDARTRPAPAVATAAALGLTAKPTPLSETDEELRIEVVQLRRAMQTRPVIDLARGVLMASFGVSAEDAWKVLVAVSQNTNTKLHEVADTVVGAVTGGVLPEMFRRRISQTIADLRTVPVGSPTS